MAEDYLTDDEQWEVLKRWIAENWAWMLAGIVIGVGGIFGWRYYTAYQNRIALNASAEFSRMTDALERSDRNAARAFADTLIKEYARSPYADQAQLALARMYLDEGQSDKAVTPLTAVMSGSKDSELKHIARLRLARVQIDQGKPDAALATLTVDQPGSFAGEYHEVRGDALAAKHEIPAALKEYQAALSTADAGGIAAGLLGLKIADLGGTAAAVTPLATLNEAKH